MPQVLTLVLYMSGAATYYDPGLMQHVVAYRASIGQLSSCAECIGAVALLEPDQIGRKVWLQPPGGPIEGPFLVADCAAPQHRPLLIAGGWTVDLDYETAARWATLDGPLRNVKVYLEAR